MDYKWSAKAVARRYRLLIDDQCPNSWKFNPSNLNYVNGWGMTQPELKKSLANFTRIYGYKSLLLGDKQLLIDGIKNVLGDL